MIAVPTRRFSGLVLAVCSVLYTVPTPNAATVVTPHGPREGRVIVRQFDRIVVTVLSEDQKIFQFPATEVERITAKDNVLLGQDTVLRKEPSETAEPVMDTALTRGLEVVIREQPEGSDWVRVQGWGQNEGWIPRAVLTNEITFPVEETPAPEAVQQPAPQPAPATAPAEAAAPEVSAATVPMPVTAEVSVPTPMTETAAPGTEAQPAPMDPAPVESVAAPETASATTPMPATAEVQADTPAATGEPEAAAPPAEVPAGSPSDTADTDSGSETTSPDNTGGAPAGDVGSATGS